MLPCCLNCGNEKIEDYHFCIRCGSELSDIAPLQILATGILLDKRYKIDSLLRESDGGIVYKAEDTRFKTICVVKELFLNYGEMNDFKNYVKKIREEIKLFCNSRHPCIPVITNYFVEKGRHYLVMDYFEGKSLKSILEDRGNPGMVKEDVKSWTMQILDMLDYAHHQDPPIIYRDINPDNIMIKDNDQRVVFLDFYLSSSDPEAKDKGILPAGDYSAPEEKKGEFSVRSDIFALGATVYYLLTGKSENFSEGKFPHLKDCLPELNGDFVPIIEQSLSLEPEERYDSAQEMKEALLKILKLEKNNHEINSLSKVTSIIQTSKPSVIELPEVTPDAGQQIPADNYSDKNSVKTEIIQPALTKQFPSSFSEPPVTKKPAVEKDELIEHAENSAKLVKNLMNCAGVILVLAFIYGIYWLYNTTVAQTLFNDGLLLYSKACDSKSDYLNSQGKGSYTDPVAKYKEAIMKFDDYSKKYNKDPKGYYMMGHCYYGIYELDVLKHMFEKSPLTEGELLQATEAFKRAINSSPSYVEGHYYLARCYYQQGNWIKSREELSIARKFLPKMTDSNKKSTWKENIDKASDSFFEPVYVASASGSSVEFVNNTDENVNIEINGKTLDSISLLGGRTVVKAMEPGDYNISVIYQEYSFTDKINLEANKGYIMKLVAPSDKFVNFDLHSFRKEK